MNLLRRRVAFLLSLVMSTSLYSQGILAQDLPKPEKAPVPEVSQADAKAARIDVADEGYTEDAKRLYATVQELNNLAEAAHATGADVQGLLNKRLMDLEQAAAFYSKLHGTCVSAQSTASGLCREKTSPQLQNSLNQINTLMGMVGGMAVNDACSNFAKAMKMAQAGLTLYTAACSTARAACEASCTTVKTNVERIAKTTIDEYACFPIAAPAGYPLEPQDPEGIAYYQKYEASVAACTKLKTAVAAKYPNLVAAIAQRDAGKEDRKSIGLKYVACTYEYGQMILSAGMGLMSVANSIKQGQKCDDATNGTGNGNGNQQKEKCDDPANASLPECICKANPRTPGCANAYQKPGESSAGGALGTGSGDRGLASDRGGPNLGGAGIPGLENAAKNDGSGSSGAGGVGAPSGGGSTGLGGGGGGSGKGPGKEEASKPGLNANILGSGGGGGGGGGAWGSGSSSSADKYRAYLPGGDKDPNKGLAGQQSWRNEVTGQGGKSNWEKVKDRYRDNTTTLLNN